MSFYVSTAQKQDPTQQPERKQNSQKTKTSNPPKIAHPIPDQQGHAPNEPTLDAGLEAGKSVMGAQAHIDPALGIPRRIITINLISSLNEADCSFWVGFTKKGSIPTASLLNNPDVKTVLEETSSKGITETDPVMIADSTMTPPRYMYLLPLPEEDFRNQAIWVEEMLKTVSGWMLDSTGFYIAPDLFTSGHSAETYELLSLVLQQFVNRVPTAKIYLLIGKHGVNPLLNAALRIKFDLENEQTEVQVFH